MMMMTTIRRYTRRIQVRVAIAVAAAIALCDGLAWRSLRAQGNPNNPIVVENLKAGDPSWSTGSSDPSIRGFATNISINTGQTVDFKIKATAPTTSYTIDIYRLGYYANGLSGDGARKITQLGTFSA